MIRHKKFFYNKAIVAIIDYFHYSVKKGKFVNSPSLLSGRKFKFQAEKKSFKISFDRFWSKDKKKTIDIGQGPKKVPVKIGEYNLLLESIWISRQTNVSYEGSVDFFHTEGFSKKTDYYYRLVFKLKRKLDFHFQIEQVIYESDIYQSCRTATKATIENDELIAYSFQDEKTNNHFFAIESSEKQDYRSFSEKAFAFKNVIGYLTGYLVGDNGYFFAYTRKRMEKFNHFYFCSLRDTIKSSYSPVYSNPYGYLHNKRSIAEKYYKSKKVTVVPITVLSELSQRVYNSVELASALILLLESSVASLLFMPGGFSIVLESVADLVIGEDKIKLSPIKDKTKAKLIKKSLLNIIETECGDLEDYDLKTLKIRIDNINSMTNGARLKAPFEKLGILLNEEDLRILETRNDFLHGRIPKLSGNTFADGITNKNHDLYYASMRFYTLLNLLILRWAGFDGYVVNYPKIYEKSCGIKLKENHYRR